MTKDDLHVKIDIRDSQYVRIDSHHFHGRDAVVSAIFRLKRHCSIIDIIGYENKYKKEEINTIQEKCENVTEAEHI